MPFLLKLVPQFKAFFSQSIPLWVALSVVLTLVGVAILAVVQQRRSHKTARAVLNKAMNDLQGHNARLKGRIDIATDQLRCYLQPFHVFECFGLLWEIDGVFLQVFRTDSVPQNVLSIVRGPFCPHCHNVVSEKFGLELAAMVLGGSAGGVLTLALPCTRCGYQLSKGPPTREVERLKVEVFREAQRLARRDEFPPKAKITAS